MVYAMFSIGILGFLVWSHHMYAVGLDVDTTRVSFPNVNSVIIIWLFAGNFLFTFSCPKVVDGIIKTICDINITEKQSAGNFVTFCKSDKMSKKNISPIYVVSEHFGAHNKPSSDIEIGYYLAGLIEGDGYIGKRGFEIIFSAHDLSNAYYIKKWVGYGTISKVKDKKAYKLIIFNQKGVEKIWNAINGKFQAPHKIQQAMFHHYDKKFNSPILPIDNISSILTTYWLSGFTDADGNFSIFIAKSKTHGSGYNITIPFRITQKHNEIVTKIKQVFEGGIIMKNVNKAGNIEHRYSTISFKIALKVEKYFNQYHPQNYKTFIRFRYWKKILIIVQNKEHLSEQGLSKAIHLKNQINKFI